jgi:cytidylate kinase
VKQIIIAVDGYSSCGKSTLAKQLAIRLGYKYIDTGAMYRAVTLYFLENDVNPESIKEVIDALNRNQDRL